MPAIEVTHFGPNSALRRATGSDLINSIFSDKRLSTGPSRRCAVKLRIMNPKPVPVSLKQDKVLGHARPVKGEIVTLLDSEDPMRAHDSSYIRKIENNPVTEWTPKLNTTNTAEVPGHLTSTLESASDACSSTEHKAQVAALLIQFSHTFSQDEFYLGLTNITEHVST